MEKAEKSDPQAERMERLKRVSKRADRAYKARHKRFAAMFRSRGWSHSEKDDLSYEHRCGRPEKRIDGGWVMVLWSMPEEEAAAVLDATLADVPEAMRKEEPWLELPDMSSYDGIVRGLAIMGIAMETLLEAPGRRATKRK